MANFHYHPEKNSLGLHDSINGDYEGSLAKEVIIRN
jgi:hypothetical protein